MTIFEAIKKLNEVIPPHDNKMVDFEHFPIAVAWETIKEYIEQNRKETAKEILQMLFEEWYFRHNRHTFDESVTLSMVINKICTEYNVEVEE